MKKNLLLVSLFITNLSAMKIEVLQNGQRSKVSPNVKVNVVAGMLLKAKIKEVKKNPDKSRVYIVKFNNELTPIKVRFSRKLKKGDFVLFSKLVDTDELVEM